MELRGLTACRSCLRSTSYRSLGRIGRSAFSTTLRRRDELQASTPPEATEGTDLAKIIRDSIKATGPIPVSRYMQLCLGHPTAGYYTRQRKANADVFGRKGDFITSPEISQVFGELVAVWLITQWAAQGRPAKVRLVELGPGRGTLLDDILRTMLAIPSFPISALTSVHCVETSLPLREQQRTKLGERIRTFGGHADAVRLEWADHITEVPVEKDTFTMVIAHEFFDALPINLFQKTPEGFREVYVNVDPAAAAAAAGAAESLVTLISLRHGLISTTPRSTASSDDTLDPKIGPTAASSSGLTLALSRTPSTLSQFLPLTSPRFAQTVKEGERVEISGPSWETMRRIGELVEGRAEAAPEATSGEGNAETSASPEDAAGGAALVMDYGDAQHFSNSFRAFRAHQIVDVFDDPGSADLTANVDFAYLSEALTGIAMPHGPITQRDFLIALGLAPRLDRLLKTAKSTERKNAIAHAARRLVQADGMGGEYKFLGVTPVRRLGRGEVYPFEAAPLPGDEAKK